MKSERNSSRIDYVNAIGLGLVFDDYAHVQNIFSFFFVPTYLLQLKHLCRKQNKKKTENRHFFRD